MNPGYKRGFLYHLSSSIIKLIKSQIIIILFHFTAIKTILRKALSQGDTELCLSQIQVQIQQLSDGLTFPATTSQP